MRIVNTAQAEQWNSGEDVAHWINNQARYDRMNKPFTALILDAAALRPGSHVLDVGCGCGGTTLAAAALIAPGQAVGVDISAPMLARAQAGAEAAGLGNAVFERGDAQVHLLGHDRFDAVISRFGIMFFADPVAAFANIRSATRPAGTGYPRPRGRPGSSSPGWKAPARCRLRCAAPARPGCGWGTGSGSGTPKPASCASGSMNCTWWTASASRPPCPPTEAKDVHSCDRDRDPGR